MKKKTNQIFNKQDTEAIDLFAELGMPKNLAKTLMYISKVEGCRSGQIEKATNLLQPQVSVSIQELSKRGWIEKYDIKKKGRGRPVHHYQLSKPLPEIIKNVENEKMHELEDVRNNLAELKKIIESR